MYSQFKISKNLSFDAIIIGSGLAGIRAATDLNDSGCRSLLISRDHLCGGSSFYPLTNGIGVELPDGKKDQQIMIQELLDTGCGLADRDKYQALVSNVTKEVKRWSKDGIDVTFFSGRPACFAKTQRPIARWENWDIIREKIETRMKKQNSEFRTQWQAIRIIVKNNKVCGVLALDENNELIFIKAPAVILATGGFASLFSHSLNPAETDGSGHSMALDAGAELVNMEFVQFIPGLISPVYKLLFCEMILRHCKQTIDADGNKNLENILPAELSFEKCLMERSGHGPFSCEYDSKYFDLAMMKSKVEEKGLYLSFSNDITASPYDGMDNLMNFYKSHGINLATDTIKVSPFAHSCNGGIFTMHDTDTQIPGLFAAGESVGGIHGADRHGGTASGCALVFGSLAAKRVIKYLSEQKNESCPPDNNQIISELIKWTSVCTENKNTYDELHKELSVRLWKTANIIRNEKLTRPTLDWVKKAEKDYNPILEKDLKKGFALFHEFRTAEAFLTSVLERKESRGSHYRTDYPMQTMKNERIFISEREGRIETHLL